MAPLISADEAQLLGVGIGMSDADLSTLIAREDAELVRRFGANYAAAPLTEIVPGGGRSIYLKRPISAITSIVERVSLFDTTTTTLTATDYYPWLPQGRIERLGGAWGAAVTVVYTPQNDTQLRKMVLIELLRIAIEQTAGGETISALGVSVSGAKDSSGAGWAAQRNAQYARLGWLT